MAMDDKTFALLFGEKALNEIVLREAIQDGVAELGCGGCYGTLEAQTQEIFERITKEFNFERKTDGS